MGFLAKVQIKSFVGLIFNLHGTKPETQPRLRPQAVIPCSYSPRTPSGSPNEQFKQFRQVFYASPCLDFRLGHFIWHIFVFILFSTFRLFFFHNNLQEFGGTKAVESPAQVLHKYKIVLFYEPRLSESFSRTA